MTTQPPLRSAFAVLLLSGYRGERFEKCQLAGKVGVQSDDCWPADVTIS